MYYAKKNTKKAAVGYKVTGEGYNRMSGWCKFCPKTWGFGTNSETNFSAEEVCGRSGQQNFRTSTDRLNRVEKRTFVESWEYYWENQYGNNIDMTLRQLNLGWGARSRDLAGLN